jgi:hypothetical protein
MNDAPPPLYSAPSPGQVVYQTAPPPRRSGCGWGAGCGIGCLLAVVAFFVIVIVAVVGVMKWVESTVNTYTASSAVPVEAPLASPAQIDAAAEKFNSFAVGMNGGGQPVPLRLTGEELNLLLWNHPAFEAVAGKAKVAIEGDQLRSQVSISFNDLNLPEGIATDLLKDKYFNGDVSLKLGMAAGRPSLYLENLSVNGTTIPEMFMSEVRSQNLLEEAMKNPDAMKLFEGIEEIRIENGELLIVPKAAP